MAEIEYYTRYLLSALAIAVLLNCVISLLRLNVKKKVYAYLRDLATDEIYEMTCYETSVGRARGSDIRFKLPSVSRAHAVIALRKDGFYIFDTESKQGVYLNGEQIEKSAKLNHGDTVAFGMAIMKFYIADESIGDIKNADMQGGQTATEYSLLNIMDGVEFPLEGEYVTIGRESGSNIEIPVQSISRRQAVLTNQKGKWYIAGLGKVTPTLLNGDEVTVQTELKLGDVIKIGDFAFMFNERE